MKQKLLLSLLVLGLVATSTFILSSNPVQAQGASMYAPGHLYNFSFRFRDQERHIYNQTDARQLLMDLIAYLQELQRALQELEDMESEVEVATRRAVDVTEDSARLRGEVTDFNRSDYATVWFEYGRYESSLRSKTSSQRLYDSDDGDFEKKVDDLRDDTKYYYRAVARDDEGQSDYGSVLSFTTDEDDTNGDPDVVSRSAINVTEESAELRGYVDMNDYRNGRVFFVYGEDEVLVDEVEDDYSTYNDIDVQGDDLQKVLVDGDLDGYDYYEEEVGSLDGDTEHFFRLCVEYENDDEDDVLECGLIKNFTTES